MNEDPQREVSSVVGVNEVKLADKGQDAIVEKEELLGETSPVVRPFGITERPEKSKPTKRVSTTFAKRGSRPQSLSAAMAGQEQGGVEHAFFVLGNIIATYAPFILIAVLVTLSLVSAFGLFMRAEVDDDLYSLTLRPATRLNREANYFNDRFGGDWETTAEVANAIATSGGKNMLTRKNMLQSANFWRKVDIGNQEVKYRNTVFTVFNVLLFSGPQPFRFNILDCWQEGAYDFFGDLGALGIQLFVDLSHEATASFGASTYTPRVNPYTWCLYAPLITLYNPFDFVDAKTFGRCRQFLDPDVAQIDPVIATIEDSYDFHRFYLYDLVRESPSLAFTWGCKTPFVNEPAGRCNAQLTCCQISYIYAECAAGTLSDETCESYQTELSVSDWSVNPHYNADYAVLDACDNFGFYPVGSILSGAIGTTTSTPTNTSLSSCDERMSYYIEDEETSESLLGVVTVDNLVQFAAQSIVCSYFGGNTCASTFGANFDWSRWIATEEEILETGLSGTCAFWEGGPEGLKILPYIDLSIALGNWFNNHRANYGVMVVYVAKGWRMIDKDLEAAGTSQPKSHCRYGKNEWLAKIYHTVKGRYDSGSVRYGMLTSNAAAEEWNAAGAIEVWLIAICYAMVIVYAGSSMIFEVTGGVASAITHVMVGILGVCIVVLGMMASLGIGCFMCIKFNVYSVQILPFLLVGLGVNDMFLCAHNYCDVEKKFAHGEYNYAEMIGYMLGRTGPSITLTTSANFVAFMIARTIGVRIVAEFCAQAAVGVLGIYFSILFGFIALLGAHAKISQEYKSTHVSMEALMTFGGKKAKVAEPTKKRSSIAAVGAAARGSVAVISQARKNFYHEVVIPNYAWFLTHPSGKMFILMLTAAIVLVGCLIGLPSITTGFPIVDFFPWGTSGAYFLYNRRSFSNERVNIVYGEADYARKHPLMASVLDPAQYSTMREVENADHIVGGVVTWYHVFIQWGLPCDWRSFSEKMNITAGSTGIEACGTSDLYESSGLYNPRCDPTDAFGIAGSCGPFVSPFAFLSTEHDLATKKNDLYDDNTAWPKLKSPGIPVCTSWPVSSFLCDGGTTQCFKDHLPEEVFNNPAVFGFHPDYFYMCLDQLLNFDALHTLFSPAFTCVDPGDPTERIACSALPMGGGRAIYRGSDGLNDMDFSMAGIWAEDIQYKTWTEDFVNMIDSLRSNMNRAQRATRIRAFPTGGLLPFMSQFRWLLPVLTRGLGYTLLGIFGIVCIIYTTIQPPIAGTTVISRLLAAAWSSVLLSILITMIVVMFLAICGYLTIILNIFTAVTTVLAVGMSVEFLAHFFSHYLLHSGNRVEKTVATLKLLLPPVIDGSITTLLGILPLCASKSPYIVNNFVKPFFIIIGLGIFFGLVSLPAVLATVGWQDSDDTVSCCSPTFGAPSVPDAESSEASDDKVSALEI